MTLTLADIERLRARAADAEDHVALEMDEDTFRGFYDRTARPLRSYLARVADPREADDLLQETYYRFLRGRTRYESEEHRRNSLFTIATNVARDRRRRRRADPVAGATGAVEDLASAGDRTAPHAETRADVGRAMGRLKPRERGLLWLAYGQGWSHREIAGALGLRPASIKPLLFRARRRLASLLRAGAPGAREIGR
ncbi:MAG: sigma-70 family RNA polymerase sigma factor [Acidobacteria bacterium]|nr:sigma-70 family RNA polymerase sigma factor [Acidobacteriota bacterium]